MTEKKGQGSDTAQNAKAKAGKTNPRTSSAAQTEFGKKGARLARPKAEVSNDYWRRRIGVTSPVADADDHPSTMTSNPRSSRSAAPRRLSTLRAGSFFQGSWAGKGVVTDILGRVLRTFEAEFRAGPQTEGDRLIVEERVRYEWGETMHRSWSLRACDDGALIGMEAGQGGRMRVRDAGDSIVILYDRLPSRQGPNVHRLSCRVRRLGDGTILMRGQTYALGVLPVLSTRVRFQPVI